MSCNMAQAQAGQLWEKSFGAHTAQLLPVNRPSPTQSKLKSGFWCCSFAYNQSPESIKVSSLPPFPKTQIKFTKV
jgi:hypothetical protein